eukprot:6597382-Prymnesium_polylepis.2
MVQTVWSGQDALASGGCLHDRQQPRGSRLARMLGARHMRRQRSVRLHFWLRWHRLLGADGGQHHPDPHRRLVRLARRSRAGRFALHVEAREPAAARSLASAAAHRLRCGVPAFLRAHLARVVRDTVRSDALASPRGSLTSMGSARSLSHKWPTGQAPCADIRRQLLERTAAPLNLKVFLVRRRQGSNPRPHDSMQRCNLPAGFEARPPHLC